MSLSGAKYSAAVSGDAPSLPDLSLVFFLSESTRSEMSSFGPCTAATAVDADAASSLGGTKACCLFLLFSSDRLACRLSFSSLFSRSFLVLSRAKYSPLSSMRSTLLGVCAGGKGLYSFLVVSRTTRGFLRCTFFFRNLGRNLSHDWSLSVGSLASSRLIISSLMWKMGCTLWMQSSTTRRTTLRPLKLPIADTVLPWTST
mmetsp:Transcript_3619/g.9071  ORF Transcript_3619/g.9071 Transcript_3619/m.9071 type:complete len:201 (-) Transcript_3619:20-622(-)